jgi:hypothetical protein
MQKIGSKDSTLREVSQAQGKLNPTPVFLTQSTH